jgi:hypothetical protein
MKKKLYYITSIVSSNSLKGAIKQIAGEIVKVTLEGEPELIIKQQKDLYEKQNKIGFTKN